MLLLPGTSAWNLCLECTTRMVWQPGENSNRQQQEEVSHGTQRAQPPLSQHIIPCHPRHPRHPGDAQPRATGAAADSTPKVYQPSGKGTASAHGVVDMAKLPILLPHAVTTVQKSPLPPLDALTSPQRYHSEVRWWGLCPVARQAV
jgi:hypothetical protein